MKPIPFIEFNITKKCNYYCEYCSQGKANKENKDLKNCDDEVIDGFIDFIQRLPEKYIVQLIGGEPFMHPKFFEITERIAKLGNKITILTNMSFPFEYFKKFIDISNNNLKLIHGALHIDQTNNLDNTINNIIKINDYVGKNKLEIVTVVEEKNIDTIREINKIFNDNNVEFIPIRMIENSVFHKYPKEIEDFIKNKRHKYNNNMIKNKSLKTKNIVCYAGKKLFHITEDGTILRCWTYQYKKPEFESFGNVKDIENIKILNNCLECYSDICNCQHPTAYNMYKSKYLNKNFYLKKLSWWIPIKSLRENLKNKFNAKKIFLAENREQRTENREQRTLICINNLYYNNISIAKKLQYIF